MKSLLLGLIGLTFCGQSVFAWNNTSNPYTFSGKVGVGTGSPQSELHIKASTPDLRIESSLTNEDPRVLYFSNAGVYWDTRFDTSANSFNIRYQGSGRFTVESDGDTTATGYLKAKAAKFFFGDVQYLHATDSWRLVYQSSDNTRSSILFRDVNGQALGSIYGEDLSGKQFGLIDSDGEWAVQIVNNQSVKLNVDGEEELVVSNGKVEVSGEFVAARIPPQGDVLMGDFTE